MCDRLNRTGQRGFTLIELMLAVGLLSLILVMLAGSFAAVSKSKIHAENRLITDEQGRAIMWQLCKELRGLVQTPLVPSRVLLIGEGEQQAGVPLDNISFDTIDVGHRRALEGFGSEENVSYSSAPNPDHRGWFMLLRSQHSALIDQTNGIQLPAPLVLADNVLGLHLRYFDGNRWQESWNSTAVPVHQQLPLAISIDLELANPGGKPKTFSTQLTIPMAVVQR